MSAPSGNRVWAAAILGAAIMFGGPATATAQTSAGSALSIARAFLDEARLRADEGDWSGAASLLAEAEENDATDSDVRYLAGLARLRNGGYPGESIAELDAALAADRFSYYSPRDAQALKAELLVRTGRFAEALRSVDGLVLDADLRWIRCRGFLGLGDRRSFDAEISTALSRFPDDPRFPRLFLDFVASGAEVRSPAPGETALGDTILGRLTRYSLLDPEMPVLAAPLMPRVSDRRDAVLAFRSTGGSSALTTLRALEYGLIDEKRACDELFSGVYPLRLADLRRALDLARNDAERAALGSALALYSGSIVVSSSPDPTETILLGLGKALSWTRSYDDERGHFTIAVSLQDERPRGFVMSLPDSELHGAYASYPFLASLVFKDASSTREYRFAPEALAYAPLTMNAFVGQGKDQRFLPLDTAATPPTQTACAASALTVVESSAGKDDRLVTSLDQGIPQRRETWRAGKLYAVLEYDRGRPTRESLDADGDGRFETERLFEDGSTEPTLVRIDTKGSGIFDYREQLLAPFRKEWDFDDDGVVDAIQVQQADGSMLRQFSTRLDGQFDESMTIAKGRILSLVRDGRKPALIADRNALVTWIGRKPFDLGSNVPTAEGVYTVMNTRIRIVQVGAQTFAEIVP